MIFSLFTLAASLAGTSVPLAGVASIADDVRAVVLESVPLTLASTVEESRAATARLLVVWSWRESAWKVGAIGDAGASLGAMQLNRSWLGGRDAEVLTDRRLALRLGLALMVDLAARCGSVRGGLRAYASGSCSGNARARELVAARCKMAEAC